MLSMVTFGVMDPLDVNSQLVKFFGLINCDVHVFYVNFFALYTKHLNLFILKAKWQT